MFAALVRSVFRKGTKRLLATGILLAGMAVGACTATPTPTSTPPTPSPSATYTVKPEESPAYTEQASLTPTTTETATPEPSPTPTEVPPAVTPIPPTPTPKVYQVLGRIFPPGYDSPGVWSNVNTGRDIVAMNFDIHFDVGLPYNLVIGQDPILSPASGKIVKVYEVYGGPNNQSEGQVIQILPDPPLQGVEEMISSAGYDPSNIRQVLFHLAHITPWKTEGWVDAGEPLGTPFDAWFEPDKIGYALIIEFDDHTEYQFSPCDMPNTASFCGKCYPGTPYPCP